MFSIFLGDGISYMFYLDSNRVYHAQLTIHINLLTDSSCKERRTFKRSIVGDISPDSWLYILISSPWSPHVMVAIHTRMCIYIYIHMICIWICIIHSSIDCRLFLYYPLFYEKRMCGLFVIYFWILIYIYWLVVLTILKNISQLGWLFPIYGKIRHVPNQQPVYIYILLSLLSIIIIIYIYIT